MENAIELIWINQPAVPTGHIMRQHSHTSYQLYYILEGCSTFFIGENRIEASRGCCLLIPPYTQHHVYADEATRSYELKLLADGPFWSGHLPLVLEPIYDKDGLLEPALGYIYENWLSKDPQNTENIRAILQFLLLRFFVGNLRYSTSASQFVDTASFSTVTKRVLHYIENHFSRPFSLDILSASLSYNKSYLCSAFRQDTGYSIVDYLNFVRIRFAVISLVFYNDDIYSVRENSGFPSSGHFSRTFRTLVGMAPRDFRTAVLAVPNEEIHALFANNPLINYRICSIDEAFSSLRNAGQIGQELHSRKADYRRKDHNDP